MELPPQWRPPPGRAAPRVFEAFPALRGEVPWLPLAHLPTAVERSPALERWCSHPSVFAKRDDLVSPLYGGNKIRRYEFVLAAAERRGSRSLLTVGALASTQVTATACFAKALGFGLTAVLYDQPVTRFAREAVLTDLTMGARLVHGGGYLSTVLHALREKRRDPGSYFIFPGASSPLANLGYLDAMLELSAQVDAGEMPRPDVIVVPTGSAGTLAALSLGAAWLGWSTEVVGVRIAPPAVTNRFSVRWVVDSTARWMHRRDPRFAVTLAEKARWRLLGDALGRGYGEPTPEAVAGIERMRELTGSPGEVTYSGKALAGLEMVARDPRYARSTLLFWHTLSTPRPAIDPDAEARMPPSLRRALDAPPVA